MKSACLLVFAAAVWGQTGVFDGDTDVGVTGNPGGAQFTAGRYRVTGGGANIWGTADAFHFVWKRISGDLSIEADLVLGNESPNAHRKAGLMIRQSLDPGAAYADVSVHGDGLTSLQYRQAAGGVTAEARSTLKAPRRIRIERRGNQFTMYAGNPGEPLSPAGPVAIQMRDPVYVGLAVCSHEAAAIQGANFSNVKIESLPRQITRSKISIYSLKDKSVQVIHTEDRIVEAPNWSPDSKYLLVNSGGNLWRLSPSGGELQKVDLGTLTGCNNDHGISPDGKRYAISARGGATGSRVYVSAADGSGVRLITEMSPSYFHGFSPDGKWLAYTAQRNGEFDLYRIPAAGGAEERLTTAKGLDDGPDYSRDGKWIYFNSERTGNFDIWRVPSNGGGLDDKLAQQVTNDEWEDWFPHPSPDGKWMVFVAFAKGTKGHPANRKVILRMMKMPGDKLKPVKIETIVELFGGQGTINVNSWAPDSKRFAFVSYELVTGGSGDRSSN